MDDVALGTEGGWRFPPDGPRGFEGSDKLASLPEIADMTTQDRN